MTVRVVANPSAGGGRARRQLPTVAATLRDRFRGRPVIVRSAESFDHAHRLTREAVADGDAGDLLIVMGGDGMMHLGVNAVAGTGRELGLIPAGSGNDLCRGLGYPLGDLDAILDLLDGEAQPMDAIRVDPIGAGPSTWVGTIVASGFDARVNLRANRMRFPRGAAQYPVALIAELLRFRPLQYDVMIDGEHRRFEAMLVAIGNTSMFGGGIAMCPDADPTDGLLDLTIIHAVSRRTLIRMFREIYTGTFTRLDEVEQIRARQVVLSGRLGDGAPMVAMGDGEEIGPVPRRIELVPGALRVHR